MHLLMISGDRGILQNKRGAFWYTLEEFSKHWQHIDIICPNAAGRAENMISGTEFDLPELVTFHPSPHALCFQPWWIFERGKAIHERNACDVMTVHEYPPFYNGIGAKWLHTLTGIPYALEIHHIVGYPEPASLTERIGYVLSRWYLKTDALRAKKVRVVNRHMAQLLGQWGLPVSKIEMIPSFYLDAEMLHRVGRPPMAYDVVCAARLVRNKGLKSVIDAVATLPACRLLLIGDGPERASLEAYVARKNLSGSVTFTGWLPTQAAVLEAMRSARVFVMSSTSEGGPRVLLEAMACGMPVISTRVGIAPDVISDGKNGILYSGSSAELAGHIRFLLENDTLRETMGKEAVNIAPRFERTVALAAYADFLKYLSHSNQ